MCLWMSFTGLNATHIVGGDLTYKCLGNDIYELSLTIRRDCDLGAPDAQFDDPASIGIFDQSGNLIFDVGIAGQLLIPFVEDDTLNMQIQSDCGFIGNQVCVHQSHYTKKVKLPFRVGGYILAYQRCCRNSSLNNIADPLQTGSTYYVEITEAALNTCNNSPVFDQWPDIYICANEQLDFSHAATDADGDQLVYSLCTPSNGASFDIPKPQPPAGPSYEDVLFVPPYSFDDPMGGTPLTIDPITGQFEAVPNIVGQYLVGVCVEEYRDGVLLSRIKRDFEYNVRVCSTPTTASFEIDNFECGQTNITFTNTSLSADAYEWNFDFPDGDAAFMSTEENPSFTFPQAGTYLVHLTATRSQDGCFDTYQREITIGEDQVTTDFDASFSSCNEGNILSLSDLTTVVMGADPLSWTWTITQGNTILEESGQNIDVLLNSTENVQVELMVELSDGCIATAIQMLEFEDAIEYTLNSQIVECTDDGIRYLIEITDLPSDYNESVVWNLLVDGLQVNLTGNPVMILTSSEMLEGTLEFEISESCTQVQNINLLLENLSDVADYTIEYEVKNCNSDGTLEVEFTAVIAPSTSLSFDEVEWTIVEGTNSSSFVGNPLTTAIDPSQGVMVHTMLAINENNCVLNKSIEIDQMNPFNFELPQNIVLCKGDALDIEIDLEPGVAILWTNHPFLQFPLNSAAQNILVPTDQATGLQTLNFMLIDQNGCSMSFEVEVEVEEHLILSSDYTMVDCENYTACFENTSNVITPVLWTFADDNGNVLGTSTEAAPCFSFPGVGEYHITIEGQSDFCAGIPFVKCFGFSDPTVDIVNHLSQLTVCSGEQLTLNAVSSLAQDQIVWCDITDGNEVELGNGGAITVEPYEGQIIVAKVAEHNDCTAYSETTTISLIDLNLNTNNELDACLGDEFVLDIYEAVPFNFVWQADPAIIAGANTSSPTISIPANIPLGVYVLNFDVEWEGCSQSHSLQINVVEDPIYSFDYNIGNCDTYTVCFTASSSITDEVLWSFGGSSNPLGNSSDLNPCFSFDDFGSYNVTLEVLSERCNGGPVTQQIDLSNPQVDIAEVSVNGQVVFCDSSIPTQLSGVSSQQGMYTWFDADGIQISQDQSIQVDPIDGDEYSLVFTAEDGCSSDAAFVTLFDGGVNIDLDNTLTTCAGSDFTFEATSSQNLSVEWAPHPFLIAGLNTLNPQISIPSGTPAGIEVLSFTATNGYGCVGEFSIEVSVVEEPSLSFDYTIEDCQNYTLCFTNTSNVNDVRWEFGDPNLTTDISSSPNPCYSYNSAGVYVVTLIYDGEYCAATNITQSIEISTPELTVADLQGDGNFYYCQNDSNVELNATGNVDGEISWFDINGTLIGQGNTVFVNPNMQTVFALLTDQNGCQSDSVEVNINDGSLELDIFQPLVLCNGDETTANVVTTQNVIFNWLPHIFLTQNLDSGTPTLSIPEDQPSGSYILQFEAENEFGCQGLFDFEVIVMESGELSFTYEVVDCENFEVCFTNTSAMFGVLIWNFGDPTTTNDISPLNDPCYVYPGPGTYEVILNTLGGNCNGSPDTMTIVLNDPSNSTIMLDELPDSIAFCSMEELTFLASSNDAAASIQWCDVDGNVLSNNDELTIVPSDGLMVFAKALDQNGCTMDTEKITFVDEEFGIGEFESEFDLCIGDTLQIALPNLIGVSYLWEADPLILTGLDLFNPTLFADVTSAPGQYQLNFSSQNTAGCILDSFVLVNVIEKGDLGFEVTINGCGDYTVCFENNSGCDSILWDFGDLTTTLDISTEQAPCYTYPGPGEYTVTLSSTGTTGDCLATPITNTIQLFANPSIDLVSVTMDTMVCKGQLLSLSATTDSQTPVTWCLIDSTILGVGNMIGISVDSSIAVLAKLTDMNGCVAVSDTININVQEFDVVLEEELVICENETIVANLINNNPDQGLIYLWGPSDCIVDGINSPNPSISATSSKTISVLVRDTITECQETFQFDLTVGGPSIAVTDDFTIIGGEEAVIEVFGVQEGDEVLWSNGSNEVIQTVMPTETTTYSVIVTDQNGCTDQASVTIEVIQPRCDDESVFIPSAFSPNGDGVNDILFVRSLFVDEIEFTVYNRWGQEIFFSDDIRVGWDGTFKGVSLTPDSYAYCIKATCLNGEENIRTGNVSLMR